MLYDPKWDLLNLTALIAWLKRQPPNEQYCFMDQGNCLLAKYFQGLGYPNVWVGGSTFKIDGTEKTRIPLSDEFRKVARTSPWTYGAALNRARNLLG